jgi:hypothetical protein
MAGGGREMLLVGLRDAPRSQLAGSTMGAAIMDRKDRNVYETCFTAGKNSNQRKIIRKPNLTIGPDFRKTLSWNLRLLVPQ